VVAKAAPSLSNTAARGAALLAMLGGGERPK
jgi:hypothetical protein